jgi:hypothetical protein
MVEWLHHTRTKKKINKYNPQTTKPANGGLRNCQIGDHLKRKKEKYNKIVDLLIFFFFQIWRFIVHGQG